MSRRCVTTVLLVAGAVLAGCAAPDSSSLSGAARRRAVEFSAHAPRHFVFQRTDGSREVSIRGDVEDDYRYQATLASSGLTSATAVDLFAEVEFDDRRMVRVINPTGLGIGRDSTLAPLATGAWVNDAANAPAEFSVPEQRELVMDPGSVLNAVRNLEMLVRTGSVFKVALAQKWDPQSHEYIRQHDKFPPHKEDGVRYDVIPAPYDGGAVFANGVPPDLTAALKQYALYESYWFKDGRITRIESFFDVDTKAVERDLRAAARREASSPVSTDARLPSVPPPYHETYTFNYPKDGVKVTLPDATATVTIPRQGAQPTIPIPGSVTPPPQG